MMKKYSRDSASRARVLLIKPQWDQSALSQHTNLMTHPVPNSLHNPAVACRASPAQNRNQCFGFSATPKNKKDRQERCSW